MPERRQHETYQFFFLKKAILEIRNNIDNLDLDELHYEGINKINHFYLPVTFPKYLRDFIKNIDKTKSLDYNFIGNILDNRKWVEKYKYKDNSHVKESNTGSDVNRKYNIDENYYSIVSKSKFTLCPIGDCPWSYRLFEAIMCFSIPVVEKNSTDIFIKDYHFLYDDQEHVYDFEKAQANYDKFIKSLHFLENNKPLIDFLKNI
uniref:RXYLT1 C-terminal domain-containing protein n=1 Tax=viral metagenome TaxID=1070528 RepID=A0A6C0CPB2_9ZZZZ